MKTDRKWNWALQSPALRPTPTLVLSSYHEYCRNFTRRKIIPEAETKVRTHLCFTLQPWLTIIFWPRTSNVYRSVAPSEPLESLPGSVTSLDVAGTYASIWPSCRTASTPGLLSIPTVHPPCGELHRDKRAGDVRGTRRYVQTISLGPGHERTGYYSHLTTCVRNLDISFGGPCIFGLFHESRVVLLQKYKGNVTLETLDSKCEMREKNKSTSIVKLWFSSQCPARGFSRAICLRFSFIPLEISGHCVVEGS